MDRNQATGLILIALLLIVYFQFLAPEPEPPQPAQETEQAPVTQGAKPAEVTPEPVQIPDSLREQQLGLLAAGASGTATTTTIETSDLRIDFSNKGAQIKEVELLDYQTYDDQPLVLLNDESSVMKFEMTLGGRLVDLYEPYYEVSRATDGDTTVVDFSLTVSPGRKVIHRYRIPEEGFQVHYDILFEGLSNEIAGNEAMLTWNNRMRSLEKDVKETRLKTTVNYYTVTDGFDGLSQRSTDYEEEMLAEPVRWVSFKQLFFNSAIIADQSFSQAKVSTVANEADPDVVKEGIATLNIPVADLRDGNAGFRFYFGPNKYQILKKVTEGFSENVYLGYIVVNWVNKYLIIPIFNLLERYIGNYGIIIILLVLIIKTLLFPLSYKSYVSMAKTRVLKPELDEIKKEHGDDMQKAQQEQMKLYQQVGVNPLSGCIPVLLQMPILFAMFFFFPNSIELRQEPFLWAEDLSTYDSILDLPFTIPMYGDHVSLFTLLMTVSTILYTWSNNQASAVQGPMKSVTYVMPLVFMFVLNSFPAGLSFYYFVTNIISFAQQAIIRRFVDDEKIRKILEENKKRNRNKKKSKFQLKLEEAMKAQDTKKKKK